MLAKCGRCRCCGTLCACMPGVLQFKVCERAGKGRKEGARCCGRVFSKCDLELLQCWHGPNVVCGLFAEWEVLQLQHPHAWKALQQLGHG